MTFNYLIFICCKENTIWLLCLVELFKINVLDFVWLLTKKKRFCVVKLNFYDFIFLTRTWFRIFFIKIASAQSLHKENKGLSQKKKIVPSFPPRNYAMAFKLSSFLYSRWLRLRNRWRCWTVWEIFVCRIWLNDCTRLFPNWLFYASALVFLSWRTIFSYLERFWSLVEVNRA